MNIGVIILLILVNLLLLWIWYRIRNRELFKMIEKMNDDKSLPLIGYGHHFIGKSPKEYIKTLLDLVGDDSAHATIQFWVWSKLSIVIQNPEDIHKVLTSPDCYEKCSCFENAPLENSIVSSKPPIWLEHRKLLNSAFNIKLLKGYIKDFNEISRKIVLDAQHLCGKGGFNMCQLVGNHVVDVALRTLFGSMESIDVISRLQNNIFPLLENIAETGLQINCHPILSILYRLGFPMFEKNVYAMLNENYDLVKNKIIIDTDRKPGIPEIFIKRMATLRKADVFKEIEVFDHVMFMLLAVTDTSIKNFNNIFIMLAMNPVAQEKCYIELIENLGEDFDEIDLDSLNKLSCLDRTIKECMRLIPTVALIGRKTAIDFPISIGTIPKGVDIFVPIFKVHRNKKYWGNQPTRFNPDHFLDENIAKRPAACYLPFSYGNRNCIGMKYANWLMRIVVAHLISKYKFTTKLKFDELIYTYGITMTVDLKQFIEVEKR